MRLNRARGDTAFSHALFAVIALPFLLAQGPTPPALQTWPPNQHPWWNLPEAEQPQYKPPSPQDLANQKRAELIVDKYANSYIKEVPGIWGISAGWANDGGPEIDMWATVITPEIKRQVPHHSTASRLWSLLAGNPPSIH